jgi:hypothetical protein
VVEVAALAVRQVVRASGLSVCAVSAGDLRAVSLTVGRARSPTSSRAVVSSFCDSAPNSASISLLSTPFDSRKATFLSRGASRITGSSRNRVACSNSVVFCASDSTFSPLADESSVVVVLCACCCSGSESCCNGDVGDVGESSDGFCCQAGMDGLLDILARTGCKFNV